MGFIVHSDSGELHFLLIPEKFYLFFFKMIYYSTLLSLKNPVRSTLDLRVLCVFQFIFHSVRIYFPSCLSCFFSNLFSSSLIPFLVIVLLFNYPLYAFVNILIIIIFVSVSPIILFSNSSFWFVSH